MNTTLNVPRLNHYQPQSFTSESRRVVHWTKLDNDNLKFMLDHLELIQSPYVFECLLEIQQRTARGNWLKLDNPPPPLHSLPVLFLYWPLCLLWNQHPRRRGRGG